MRSRLAEALRREDREAVLALPPDERIALAQRLGDEALAAYCAASGLSVEEARRAFERQRQEGRTYSACVRAIIEA
ncbi:MAG: hypothetical protein U0X73_17415 [Thermoanaerobaculia bacterium]